MKQTIIIVLLFGIFQSTYGQHKLRGIVTDQQTKEKLIGATIYITDLKTGTATDRDGAYLIGPIKKGSYLIEVSLLGYKRVTERLVIRTDTILNFTLNEATTELNHVVVTAVSHSTELKHSPIVIKPVDLETLNQTSSTNLIDALKNIPGVNQITTGAGISKPTIRGLGYNRIITLYNGIRQEGQQWGDEHGIEIDEYAIDRVEIVKGPGSLMYGSDGIAGVINFISPKAPHANELKTQLVTDYQTNNNLIGTSISNAGNKNGFQWLGRISNKLAGNYRNKYDGIVYNSGFKEHSESLALGLNKKWGYTHIDFSSFSSTLNMIEGERDQLGRFTFLAPDGLGSTNIVSSTANDLNGYQIGFPHQQVDHLRFLANNFFILQKGTLNFDIGFQNNTRKEFGDIMNPNNKALFFDLSTINYNLRYNLTELKGWDISLGINGIFQGNKNKGLEFLIPAYHLFDAGGFVFGQKTVAKDLILAGGFRVDSRTIAADKLILDPFGAPTNRLWSLNTLKFKALNNNYTSYSGSIGLSYQADHESTFKINLSRGFRAPNIAEIASNGKHEGSFRYEYGTSNLNPELSHQIDVAYFLNTDHLTFEATPFVNFISNYIYSRKLSNIAGGDSIPNSSDPAPAFKFAQGNAVLKGGEIYFDIHPHPLDWLHIENSFSFVQATQNNQPDSTKYLTFIPPPKYSGELKAKFKKIGKSLTNGYLKFGIDYYFKQDHYFKAYQTETPTPAYTLLSAGLGANVKAFKKADFLSIYLSAENLADVAYQSHLSRLKYGPLNPMTGKMGVCNMGRNISLKLIFNM